MKKIYKIFLLLFIVVSFMACDYVSNTIEPKSNVSIGTDTTKVYRKVLIEDYTGHRCGNCPRAALILHDIDSVYHGKVVPLAVHCTNFANPNVTYPEDFRTVEGTDYDNVLGVSASSGLPNGLVNREGFGTAGFVKSESAWESSATPFLNQEADFKIEIANVYNSSSNSFNSEIKVTALKNMNGEYNLTILLIEDSIIGPQYDQSLPVSTYPTQIKPDYIFMHVLRTSLNTAWGNQILNGAISKNQVVTKTFTNFPISSSYVAKNCQIIAYVYDAATSSPTRYEVKQVEIAPVKQ